VLGSTGTLCVDVAWSLDDVVVGGPLRLEVHLWLHRLVEDSGMCSAIPPYVSRLTAANAELIVESSLLLWSGVVHPVHLYGKMLYVTEVSVSREILFRRKAGSGAVTALGFKVIFLLEGLKVVEFYPGSRRCLCCNMIGAAIFSLIPNPITSRQAWSNEVDGFIFFAKYDLLTSEDIKYSTLSRSVR
jgi:hypothetical protein